MLAYRHSNIFPNLFSFFLLPNHSHKSIMKLDQETWLCRTHLDELWTGLDHIRLHHIIFEIV